ncbi:ATP-grasp domain-containing protein [Cellulomonas telluris]|uniref:ATP-grasp domain-containing protein n=1 Tax=Cellulomonas telluris TaxID=2306636 RepID=UPI001CA38E3D|nr:ATP-grasp domain-containing protein [Cellulomonas telluris]
MTDDQTLLMVGVGRMGRPYVDAARRLGVRVHAVEAAERAALVEPLVDGVTLVEGGADEAWARAAWAAAAGERPAGVVAFSEVHVLAAALLQDALALPGPSLHAATLSRNKALQRGRFAAVGVPQPDFAVVDDPARLRDWARPRLPVVLKSLSSAGSAGVELMATVDDLDDALARRAGEGRFVVEDRLEGPELSWEAVVVDGAVVVENVTAKDTTGAPHFVETAHRTGIVLDPPTAGQVGALARGVLDGLGMVTGLVHLELCLTRSGPAVIEVAVRTPGDFIMDLLGLTYGTDWFELVVRAALGRPLPPVPVAPAAYAASWFATPEGRVIAVDGVEAVGAQPHVVEVEITCRPGDVVGPVRSSGDRSGHVVVCAPTPQERDAALALVRDTLVIRTEQA